MKKIAILSAAGLLVMSVTSCDLTGKHKGHREGNKYEREIIFEEEEEEDEPEAEYYGEVFEINSRNVIDPNDDDAYRKYGVDDDEEEEVYVGPSDVDILDMDITETSHIDILLAELGYCTDALRRLMKDSQTNAAAIQRVLDRVVRITEKINEGSTHMTHEQLAKYSTLTDEFLAVVK